MSQAPTQNGHDHEPQGAAPKPQDFTPDEIPDQLQDDVLVQYLRCRYDDQNGLLLGRKSGEKERVEREIARIAELRATYESTKENKPVVDDFKRLRAAWKIHAQANSNDAPIDVWKRVKEMKKIPHEDRERRFQLECQILSKVKEWNEQPYTPEPPTPIQGDNTTSSDPNTGCFSFLGIGSGKKDDGQKKKPEKKQSNGASAEKRERPRPPDSYGISVSKITLKKNPTSSSYMSYDIERYPLNKVLYSKEDNPLKRMASTDDPNTIRYFHFPSNNMHWIEVFIPKYPSCRKTNANCRKPSADTMTKTLPENTTGVGTRITASCRRIFCVASIGLHSSSKATFFTLSKLGLLYFVLNF